MEDSENGVAYFLFFLMLVFGTILAVQINIDRGIVPKIKVTPASVHSALLDYGVPFEQTGTLFYYPNNVGPIPWFLYLDDHGATTTKSLTVPAGVTLPPSGSTILVRGLLEFEHVRVESVTLSSAS